MLIRRATPDDLPRIRELEQQAETAAHWADREYEALFVPEAPRRIALVAIDPGGLGISGFLIARCLPDEWEIENVVVALEQRRRGLASALVSQLVQEAHTVGITSVLLEVRESNLPARRLYEKLGFREIGRRSGYYQQPSEDALLLKISISFL